MTDEERLQNKVAGKRIKELRESKGMKRPALAEIIGVDPNTLYRYETGLIRIKDVIKRKIAKALGSSVAYLMGETDDPRRYTTLLTDDENAAGNKSGDLISQEMIDAAAQAAINSYHKSIGDFIESNLAPYNPAHMIRVRVLDKMYGLCCGTGVDWGSEAIEFEEVLNLQIPELAQRYSDGDVIGARADGNSMEPRIYHGDLVLFVPHEKEILYAGIMMVVSYNNKMLIRGVVMNNKKNITLKAINKAEHDDIVVTPDDDFDVCGRVVKIFSVSDPGTVL